jgi:hypothetical protein
MERARKIALTGLMVGLLSTGSVFAQTPTFVCPGAAGPRLQPEMQVVVTPGFPPINVRSAPGFQAARVGTLKAEVPYEIIDGPACANRHLWWQIKSADVSGWVVEGEGSDTYLTPYQRPAIAVARNGIVSVDDGGISFQFDSTLAPAVGAATVKAVPPPPDPSDGLPGFIAPAGIQYIFFDGTENEAYPRSTLTIYPANGFRPMSVDQGDKLDALKALIDQQTASEEVEIPEVPSSHYAAQMIRASIKYLTLPDGGRGVRYLSYYSQADVPATNGSLYYEFRGFEGSDYIRLEYAVSASVLPDRLISTSYWGENDFHKYGTHVTSLLTDLPSDQFAPDLGLLDALAQTIKTANG